MAYDEDVAQIRVLDDIADELYALPPEAFTAARNARAKLAKDAGDRALALGTPFHQRFALQAWFDALPAGGLLDAPGPAAAPPAGGDPTAWRRYIAATGAANPHRIGD